MGNRRVHRETGRHQRRGWSRVEPRGEPERKPAVDDDMVAESAIGIDADNSLIRAELLDTLAAQGALEARSELEPNADAITACQVGGSETSLLDTPDHLVTRDEWKLRVAPIIVDELNVPSGQATVRNTHQDIMRAKGLVIDEGRRGCASLLNCVGSDFHPHPVQGWSSDNTNSSYLLLWQSN